MKLNRDTAQIEVRPRDVEQQLELGCAPPQAIGVASVEERAKALYSGSDMTFHLLTTGHSRRFLAAASSLDGDGVCWPDLEPEDDRRVRSPGPI